MFAKLGLALLTATAEWLADSMVPEACKADVSDSDAVSLCLATAAANNQTVFAQFQLDSKYSKYSKPLQNCNSDLDGRSFMVGTLSTVSLQGKTSDVTYTAYPYSLVLANVGDWNACDLKIWNTMVDVGNICINKQVLAAQTVVDFEKKPKTNETVFIIDDPSQLMNGMTGSAKPGMIVDITDCEPAEGKNIVINNIDAFQHTPTPEGASPLAAVLLAGALATICLF